MKAVAAADSADKKGHICPPSDATHPRDRWESAFVYAFVCKFTNLRSKVEGLDTPMDFEEALLSEEPHPIVTQILARFILNLRPQTRNLSSDVISSTLATIMHDYFKTTERTVFWDENLKVNVDPFSEMQNGFFAASWDFKLKIMRQLVELQLCHSAEIKAIIDRAWGVIHNKHKKAETTPAPPPANDPHSQENLQLQPLGQDKDRKRYWAVDDSPRLYISTNPWKITATFQTISSTRDEYMAIVEKVQEIAPPEPKAGERKSKLDTAHIALVKALQGRIEAIDAELAKIQRARRKIEQRNLLIAQAEVRETRTRRRTTRPDYAYMNDPASDQEDEEYEDQGEFDDMSTFRGEPSNRREPPPMGRRRSTRASNAANNGKRGGSNDDWNDWREKRRSTRLGVPAEPQPDMPPLKRARTDDSVISAHSTDGQRQSPAQNGNGPKIKISGAAAIKPTETAVEALAGKKKSKYWFYAIEPIPAPQHESVPAAYASSTNGSEVPMSSEAHETQSEGSYANGISDDHERSIEGSLSPASPMDES
ncbi:hypothetical protein IEO21_05077 [Rhodonia placenta]|uniref:WHIM1 domain-containing protein n=1 Tax=Rhodonia placenta TaxID=104341 RepID=A0A8H7U1Z2_9APHY|nr:hypothetical protein IEO21_05077 [Postia placenta]